MEIVNSESTDGGWDMRDVVIEEYEAQVEELRALVLAQNELIESLRGLLDSVGLSTVNQQ